MVEGVPSRQDVSLLIQLAPCTGTERSTDVSTEKDLISDSRALQDEHLPS